MGMGLGLGGEVGIWVQVPGLTGRASLGIDKDGVS